MTEAEMNCTQAHQESDGAMPGWLQREVFITAVGIVSGTIPVVAAGMCGATNDEDSSLRCGRPETHGNEHGVTWATQSQIQACREQSETNNAQQKKENS